MTRRAPIVLGLLLVTLPGCAWIREHKALFPTPADVACVAADVEAGVSDPGQVIADCPHLAVLALEDVVSLIEGTAKAKARRPMLVCK